MTNSVWQKSEQRSGSYILRQDQDTRKNWDQLFKCELLNGILDANALYDAAIMCLLLSCKI